MIKGFRRKHRLTQEDVARVLGVSQAFVSMLENEKRPLSRRVEKSLREYSEQLNTDGMKGA